MFKRFFIFEAHEKNLLLFTACFYFHYNHQLLYAGRLSFPVGVSYGDIFGIYNYWPPHLDY